MVDLRLEIDLILRMDERSSSVVDLATEPRRGPENIDEPSDAEVRRLELLPSEMGTCSAARIDCRIDVRIDLIIDTLTSPNIHRQ